MFFPGGGFPGHHVVMQPQQHLFQAVAQRAAEQMRDQMQESVNDANRRAQAAESRAQAAEQERDTLTRTIQKDSTFGDYEKVKELGRGGFGTVFHVKLKTTGADYAAKAMVVQDVNGRRIALREIKKLEDLSHENIVKQWHSFEYENLLVLIMDLLEPLTKELQRHPQGFRESNRMFQDITLGFARGLHYLHSCKPKILHRDLKPDNLAISRRGGRAVLKIIDFGAYKEQIFTSAASAGGAGSSYFFSMERHLTGVCGWEDDIFAYGVIVGILVLGVKPFFQQFGNAYPGMPGTRCRTAAIAKIARKSPKYGDLVAACWKPHDRSTSRDNWRPDGGAIEDYLMRDAPRRGPSSRHSRSRVPSGSTS
jgi:serine/threonine protein kinase